jgi:hypothetical protein
VFDLCEQQFHIEITAATQSFFTPVSEVCKTLGAQAQNLIDRYVEMEAFALSQVL